MTIESSSHYEHRNNSKEAPNSSTDAAGDNSKESVNSSTDATGDHFNEVHNSSTNAAGINSKEAKKVSMTREFHNHILQTNQW